MSSLLVHPKYLPVVGLLLVCLVGLGSSQSLIASPNPFSDHVTITCRADDIAYESRKVVNIQIGREGRLVASINNDNLLKTGPLYTKNMEVKARVSQQTTKSFISVIIHYAKKSDAGLYSCLVNFMNRESEKGHEEATTLANFDGTKWRVAVFTSWTEGSNTNSFVYMQIVGEFGKTEKIQLDNKENNFEKNAEDDFIVETRNVGTPKELVVWHEEEVLTRPIAWHLDRIELSRIEGDSLLDTYEFACDCWFRSSDGHHNINKTLQLYNTKWEAKVTTSNFKKAYTDSLVSISLIGAKGQSRPIHLDSPKDDFENGQTDVFYIWTNDVGSLTKIRVTAGKVPWHLDTIVLENVNGAETYRFKCNCWIGKGGKEETKEIMLST